MNINPEENVKYEAIRSKPLFSFKKIFQKADKSVAYIALVISLLNVLNNSHISKRDFNRQNETDQLTFHPELVVINSKIENYEITDGFQMDDSYMRAHPDDTTWYQGSFQVKYKITIVNNGNSKAKLLHELFIDTTSGEKIIQKKIITKDYSLKLHKLEGDYYPDKQVLPGDTLNAWYNIPVNYLDDNMFTLHIYLVYQNEKNHTFETYYRERFETQPVEITFSSTNNRQEVKYYTNPIDRRNSTSICSAEYAAKIEKYFTELLAKN